jgi:predicted RNA-binding Zn ribbon-like protein
MATSTTRFRQGAGRLCLDFIRTLRWPGTPSATEELPDAAALAAWIGQFGPLKVAPSESVGVAEAHALREAIRDLVDAARTGRPYAEESCATVNRAAAHATPVPSVDGTGRLRWHADDPLAASLSLVARDALDLVTSPATARLRTCAGPRCGALFLDNSRPGTRRWCSMDTCGNQAKKANLRRREA